MATLKFQSEFTPERNATVQAALDVFRISDFIRVRNGIKTNYGQPTRKYVTELGSEVPLSPETELIAETTYNLWWEIAGIPDFAVRG